MSAAVRLLARVSLRAAPGWLAAATIVTLGGAVCLSLYPLGLRIVIDGLLGGSSHLVLLGMVLAAGWYSVGWVCQVAGANLSREVTDRVELRLATEVARRAVAVPGIGHHDHPDRARELDMARVRQSELAAVPRQLLTLAQVGLRLAVVLALLAWVYPPLVFVPVAGVVPYLIERAVTRRRERAEDAVSARRRLADQLFQIGTSPASAMEMRTFGLADAIRARHGAVTAEIAQETRRSVLLGATLRVGGWTLFTAVLLLGAGVTLLHTLRGQTTPGQLLMVITLVRRVQMQFPQAAEALTHLGAAHSSAERLERWEELPSGGGGRAVPERLHRGITLRGVGYTFPSSVVALEDVDLHLPAGAVVALIGANGSGKTTLVRLLSGMYRPGRGHIVVDGVDISEFPLRDWQSRVTGTLQDFQRFRLTVGGNVGVGHVPHVDDPAAQWAALHRANAEDTVRALPFGLDTDIAGMGVELSGGQWQHLALARGLMRESPLLMVLDEPTSSLDPETEYAVVDQYARVARAIGRRTGAPTVLVTHRLSTARVADMIVMVADGRVRECGGHSELMAAHGAYAELFRLQTEGYR